MKMEPYPLEEPEILHVRDMWVRQRSMALLNFEYAGKKYTAFISSPNKSPSEVIEERLIKEGLNVKVLP